jgi:hypothetical protein
MIVRIRLGRARSQRKTREKHNVALGLASLLTPAAVMALVLAVWPLAADLKFAGAFPIDQGVFSHWQVWMVLACGLQSMAMALNRVGKTGEPVAENLRSRERALADSQF